MKLLYRHGFVGLFAVLLGLLLPGNAARADQIFVTNFNTGTIGEYTTSGATVNAALISGLGEPFGIVIVPTATTPEPSSLTLLGLVLMGLAFRGFRRYAKRGV